MCFEVCILLLLAKNYPLGQLGLFLRFLAFSFHLPIIPMRVMEKAPAVIFINEGDYFFVEKHRCFFGIIFTYYIPL
jgi:hypothetical protein